MVIPETIIGSTVNAKIAAKICIIGISYRSMIQSQYKLLEQIQ
jgi:hypothetical protein